MTCSDPSQQHHWHHYDRHVPTFFSWEMLCMTLINFGNCACHSLDVAGHVQDFWWLQVPQMKGKNVTQNNVKYVPSDRLIAKWGWAIELGVSLQSPSHLQGKGGGCSTKMLVEFVKKEKGCTDGFSSLQPGLFLYQGETSVMRIQLIPLLSWLTQIDVPRNRISMGWKWSPMTTVLWIRRG